MEDFENITLCLIIYREKIEERKEFWSQDNWLFTALWEKIGQQAILLL